MSSDFRIRDPETARNITIGLESILFAGATSGSTTPTSMNSDAIAYIVVVYLVRTPVRRDIVPISTLTEEQTRQAFSVIPSDYWQLSCWTCRGCGHSTFVVIRWFVFERCVRISYRLVRKLNSFTCVVAFFLSCQFAFALRLVPWYRRSFDFHSCWRLRVERSVIVFIVPSWSCFVR